MELVPATTPTCLEEGKGIHNHQAVPKVIPEVRVLGIQRILLAHILLRVHEVVVHRLRMLLEKMENPQFHVHPVGHHAICAQLILQPIEEESSIHVKLKAATSLFGKIMPTAEEQSHEEVPADQHLLPAGEVVVAGVTKVEDGQMM